MGCPVEREAWVLPLNGWASPWRRCWRARREAAETEERLRMSLSGARAGAWQWNLLTQEVTWSPEIYDLLGLPQGMEPSFEAFFEVVDPEHREAIQARLSEILAQGGPFELEFRLRRADGAEMWLSSVGRVVKDAAGRPALASGINQDITARRQAEEQREEARRTLQLVLEIAQAGVWEWDVVEDRVRGDENLARLFHLPAADVVTGRLPARDFFRAMHREDRPHVERRLQEVFATGGLAGPGRSRPRRAGRTACGAGLRRHRAQAG